MENLFELFIGLTISGSIAAIAVMALRLFLSRAPRQLSYLMWAVVFLRFALPFSFELPILEPVTLQADSLQGSVANPLTLSIGTTSKITSAESIVAILPYIWLAGVAVLIVYIVVSYIVVSKSVRFAVKERGNIYRCSEIKTPFVFGVIKPKIYLPGDIRCDDIDNIILHEQAHIDRLDHITKPIFFIITAVHWFNPIAWIVYGLMNSDMEMACDERATKGKDGSWCAEYAHSLLRFATNRRIAFSILFSVANPERRILNILKNRSPNRLYSVLFIIPVIFFAACFAEITRPITIVSPIFTAPEAPQPPAPPASTQQAKHILPLNNFSISNSYNYSDGYVDYFGVDMVADQGSMIYATADGRVLLAQNDTEGYGRYIVLEHDDGTYSLYAHCSELLAEFDQQVKQGDVIALVGNTGNSTGSQLHFEIRNDIDMALFAEINAEGEVKPALYNFPQIEQAIDTSNKDIESHRNEMLP